MTTTVDKRMSYVLARLYPGAFASYRGVVFRVTEAGQDPLRGVKPDTVETPRISTWLQSDHGRGLLKVVAEKIRDQIATDHERSIAIDPERISVSVPGKVSLRFDESLTVLYCPNCGAMRNLNWIRGGSEGSLPDCTCGHRFAQAPVLVPRRVKTGSTPYILGGTATDEIVRPLPRYLFFCSYSKKGGICRHPQNSSGKCPRPNSLLRVTNPQRPLESLRVVTECPLGLPVEERRLRVRAPPGIFYQVDFPRESITSPLTVSAVRPYSLRGDTEISEVNDALREVTPLLFNPEIVDLEETRFSRLDVLEVTYGYRIGTGTRGFSAYYVEGDTHYVLGRQIRTEGFVLKLKPVLRDRLRDIWDRQEKRSADEKTIDRLVQIVLHTAKHALLVAAPTYAGLEPDQFFGSYERTPDGGGVVYVYDNEDGGCAGFASLIGDRFTLISMLEEASKRLECPIRRCEHACKQCIFFKNCGNSNRGLNRKLLLQLEIFRRAHGADFAS